MEKGYFRLNDPIYDFIPEYKDIVVIKRNPNGGVSPKTGEKILTQRTIDIMRTNNLTETQFKEDFIPKSLEIINSYKLQVRILLSILKSTVLS